MFIIADGSQLEWRVAVELSKDTIGIQELNDPTIDIHSQNEIALTLPSRLIAKIFLFRTIFRGSGWSFANDPAFTHVSADPKYWTAKNEAFYVKYKGLDKTHHKWAQMVASRKPLTSFTGREWFIPMGVAYNQHKMEIGEKIPWTVLSNYPVQGTGADIMMLARISLRNRLQRANFPGAMLVSTVHDSLVVDSPSQYLKPIAALMYEVFEDIPKNIKKLFKHEVSMPFPCEVKYGPNLLNTTKLLKKDLV